MKIQNKKAKFLEEKKQKKKKKNNKQKQKKKKIKWIHYDILY